MRLLTCFVTALALALVAPALTSVANADHFAPALVLRQGRPLVIDRADFRRVQFVDGFGRRFVRFQLVNRALRVALGLADEILIARERRFGGRDVLTVVDGRGRRVTFLLR